MVNKRWHPALVAIGALAFLVPVVWLMGGPKGDKPPAAVTPTIVPSAAQPVASPPVASPPVETADAKTPLTWGAFADHPARRTYEDARLVGAKDVLLLYHGLRRAPLEPDEFAAFFPDWRATDSAWERSKTAEAKQRQLEASYEALDDQPLVVRNREIRIGPYDRRRGGFPLYRSPDPRTTREGLPRTVIMWDLSASGQADLRRINAVAARHNRRYTNLTMAVELENVGWRALEVVVLPWPAAGAARVEAELGHGQPLDDPQAIRELGRGEQAYRTVTGHFLVRPTRTEAKRVTMEGEAYLRKTVHAHAATMILATPHGTVLGVYSAD